MKIDAVILGGGGVEEWFAGECVPNKGMLDIAGRPMVEYVIDALKKSQAVGRIILIGDGYNEHIIGMSDLHLPDSGSLKGNIDQGFAAAGTEYVLITTSDVPLVTGNTYDSVINSLIDMGCDLGLPVITKEDTEKKLPGTKRTFVKLKEGLVKVGNLFFARKEAYKKIEPIVEETSKRRKSAIKQALQLGVPFLLRLLILKNVSLPELENRVSKILGVATRAPILPCPELGVDVDKMSDLDFCRKYLEKK